MAIAEHDKIAIKEALSDCFYVETDKNGNKFVEIYADYRDTNEFLLQTAYDHRKDAFEEAKEYESENGLLFALEDKITEAFDSAVWEYESEVIQKADVDFDDSEEQLEYLRDLVYFAPPYDHFLNQDMNVNILLGTPEERNCEFTLIHDQYLAMADPDEVWSPEESHLAHTGISWLLEQQGYTMDDLSLTMMDYNQFFNSDDVPDVAKNENGKELPLDDRIAVFNQTHSRFLTSVCQELENHTYSMGVLTILAKVSMYEFAEMMQRDREITFAENVEIGIFNPWNGSGSVLEIDLDKPLTVPSSLIFDVQIEGVKPEYTYTVDDAYGLVESAWKKPVAINPTKSSYSKAMA